MRTLTTEARTNIESRVNVKPELIVSVNWGEEYGIRYYGERSFYLGELYIEGALLKTGSLASVLSAENVASISSFEFTLDMSGENEDSVLDILDSVGIENKKVNVYQYFNTETFTVADLLHLFYGRVEGGSKIIPSDKTINVVASNSSLDTYNVGLKKTETIENTFECQWIDQPFALWNSVRGDDVLVNPSPESPVYETRKNIDGIVRDGVPGYLSIRVRDSSPEVGDLAYRQTTSTTIVAGQYELNLAFHYLSEKNYISSPDNEFLVLVFDPTTNFSAADEDRLFVPVNFGIPPNKWRRRRLKFDLDEAFTYQSIGFKISREIPDNHFVFSTISLVDGSSVPAPNPDRWVKFRIDGMKLCERRIFSAGLSPYYFLDDEDAWPIAFGCVRHIPALRITSVPLSAVAQDFELYSNIADGIRTLEVTNSSRFPQDTNLKLTIEHTTTDGKFRKSVIRGSFSGNTFTLSETNPRHFEQILDLDKRPEDSEFLNNGDYAWLKAGSVYDLKGRLAFLNPTEGESRPILVLEQTGTRIHFVRISEFDSGLPIPEETVFVPFVPIPSLIGRVPPIKVYVGNPPPLDDPFSTINMADYGSPEHVEYENNRRQEALTDTLEGNAEALGKNANIKDVRNFPVATPWKNPTFTKGNYTILAGSQIYYDADYSGIKYVANLYPSEVVSSVSAVKGVSIALDETTDELVTEDGAVRTPLTDTVGALGVLAEKVVGLSKTSGGQTVEINVGKLAGFYGSTLKSKTDAALGVQSSGKLKKSTVAELNTTGVNNSGDVLKEVPVDLYTVNLAEEFGEHTATIITFQTALEEREGENWGDQIYVTLRSSLPSNLARIIKWIIDEHIAELEVDDTSFIEVSTKIQDLPGNFCLFGNNNAKDLIQKIAWMAKSGVIFDGNTVKLKFLDERPI